MVREIQNGSDIEFKGHSKNALSLNFGTKVHKIL